MSKQKEQGTPRRINQSVLDRIDKYIDKSKYRTIGKKKTVIIVKDSFNEFLEKLLDVYDMVKDSQVYYTNELYEDLAAARGDAITKAVKTKQAPIMPTKVVVVGKDEL